MAAVAPAAPPAAETVPVVSAPDDEAAAPAVSNSPSNEPMDADEDHHTDDEDEEHAEDEEHEEAVKEWDEGGKSHCGYGDQVHDTLMSIGESIHKVVGDPNDSVQGAMQSIGNWFQEASYAARDLKHGKMDMAEETAAAMKSVVSGDEDDNKEEAEGVEGVEGEGQREEEPEIKLEPVKEDIAKEEAASP
mmetsp:Transcript_8307/g.20406  ORF Transcript_8307/g.20406 Transcript_8307/m.20406 type:complete len:190 (-) Transcript_8307:297-866(-)|eukprot:CAMPEP_0181116138 /NCGR_PEP_ID=MMETSP1071-20121207/21792_1 /TAXON_ID=35127 /ORGANISM="Thalassiosira sp., Strain NH16" /LENGTH=189 /DNA_ID=CAMNT_0023200365 /DNA_START=59 /DNA_END=628 /DNA_ORIENTATION=+